MTLNALGMIYFSMSALLPQGSLYIFTSDPIQIGLIALPNGIVQVSRSFPESHSILNLRSSYLGQLPQASWAKSST